MRPRRRTWVVILILVISAGVTCAIWRITRGHHLSVRFSRIENEHAVFVLRNFSLRPVTIAHGTLSSVRFPDSTRPTPRQFEARIESYLNGSGFAWHQAEALMGLLEPDRALVSPKYIREGDAVEFHVPLWVLAACEAQPGSQAESDAITKGLAGHRLQPSSHYQVQFNYTRHPPPFVLRLPVAMRGWFYEADEGAASAWSDLVSP